jgi:hypothetical protein
MMSTQLPADASSDNLHKGYRVVSVQKTSDRALGKPDDWYCYTIIGGKSRIKGLRRGTLAEVTEYADECAEAISTRSMAATARALTWSSRNKK